jgi:hypothetical protein
VGRHLASLITKTKLGLSDSGLPLG